MSLGTRALKGFLVGTVVATLLLAAQSGGNPLRDAAWILVGTILTALTEAYGTHVSSHNNLRGAGYRSGLARNIAQVWSEVVACLPTVGCSRWPHYSVGTMTEGILTAV